VEFFKDIDYNEFSNKKILKSFEVNDIASFYEKVQKQPFKVRQFNFQIKNKLNDCLLEFREFPLREDDTLQIEYKFEDYGLVPFNYYMDFLHNAYKESDIVLNSESIGNWNRIYNKLSPV
jgi:hypothetical protein